MFALIVSVVDVSDIKPVVEGESHSDLSSQSQVPEAQTQTVHLGQRTNGNISYSPLIENIVKTHPGYRVVADENRTGEVFNAINWRDEYIVRGGGGGGGGDNKSGSSSGGDNRVAYPLQLWLVGENRGISRGCLEALMSFSNSP